MSVPGRIGTILIVVLTLVDALILASGARRAANAIETHSMEIDQAILTHAQAVQHDRLLSAAIREINLLTKPAIEKPTRI
jgi:hypothetical protein